MTNSKWVAVIDSNGRLWYKATPDNNFVDVPANTTIVAILMRNGDQQPIAAQAFAGQGRIFPIIEENW